MQQDCVRVDRSNRVLGPCTRQDALDGVPHRVVWGMLYHPIAERWALQWRRPEKGICPLLWDMSCAGHVDWIHGTAESYQAAYARELGEELCLGTKFWSDPKTLMAGWKSLEMDGCAALTLDLGATLHELPCMVQGGATSLLRQAAGHFLTLHAGPLTLPPDAEPLALAWMSTAQVQELIIASDLATPGLSIMLARCSNALRLMLDARSDLPDGE